MRQTRRLMGIYTNKWLKGSEEYREEIHMTKRPEVLVASDIITKIAEGDASIVSQLQS